MSLKVLSVSVILLFIAGSGAANVFRTSPIIPVERSKFPQFDAIGLVERTREIAAARNSGRDPEFVGSANAFYVSPCTILTNYHVPYGNDIFPVKNKDYQLLFRVGFSRASPFDQTIKLTVVAGFRIRDFAVMKDPTCSGMTHGWYEPSPISREDLVRLHQKVIIVWLSGGQSKGQMQMSAGYVTGMDGDTGNVLTDASAVPGSSGGIVFVVDPRSKRLMFQGLNVGSVTKGFVPDASDPKAEANEFLNYDSLDERVEYTDRVEADLKAHPIHNPLDHALYLEN